MEVDTSTPPADSGAQAEPTGPALSRERYDPSQTRRQILRVPGESKPADPWAALPEKFATRAADGSIDRDASFAKMAESYRHLESRVGKPGEIGTPSAGLPASPADYVVNVPEQAAGWFDANAEDFKSFTEGAFEAGLTQAQVDYVLGKYVEAAPKLVGGAQALDTEEAIASLRETWPDDAAFEGNIRAARRAVEAFGGPELLTAIGNDPASIRAWAKVGKELGEDTPPTGAGGRHAADVKALMAHPAYSDASHADHDRVSKQVADFYRRQPGGSEPL